MGVHKQQKERKAQLGPNVEYAVRDDFGVDRDFVGSFGKGKDDGVGGPEAGVSVQLRGNKGAGSRDGDSHEGHNAKEVEQPASPARTQFRRCESVKLRRGERREERGLTPCTAVEEGIPQHDEPDTRHGVERPPGTVTVVVSRRRERRDESRDNHEYVRGDREERLGGREAREDREG